MKITVRPKLGSVTKKLGLLLYLVPLGVCAVIGVNNAQKTAAWLAYTKKDYTTALDRFTQAGDDSGRGLVFLAQHRGEDAAAAFQRAGDLRGLGLTALDRRQFTAALDLFTRAGDESGRGLVLLKLHRPDEARAAFTEANDWSGLGLLALDQRDPAEARRCFAQVSDERGLGLVALKEQKFDEAALHFEKASDDSGRALLALAQGRIEAAQAIAEKSNDRTLLGACHLACHRLEEAEAAFAAANDWNGLGDAYSLVRQFAKARDAFAFANQPVKVIQSFRNDWTLGDTERLAQAIAYGKKVLAAGIMVPESLCEMADVYYELGQYDKALDALTQAGTHPGFVSEAALRRGRIYFYLRDYEKARGEFTSVKSAEVGDLALQAAQESLATLDRYRDLKIEPAPSF